MKTPEELHRLAQALNNRQECEDDAADALREYADSLERDPEPVAYMTEYFSPDCGPQYEIYKADDMGWRDKSQYTPLYLHPPRSEPPKMTEAETCTYPKCNCPFDMHEGKCARGLNHTVAQRIAGPKMTEDEFFTLLGHAEFLRLDGKSEMPKFFADLAIRFAPDDEHAARARDLRDKQWRGE